MYKRYYDGYGVSSAYESKGEVIVPKESADEKSKDTRQEIVQADISTNIHVAEDGISAIADCSRKNTGKSILSGIELDDIILIGVILLISKENPEDPMLILILAAIFLLGILGK